MNHSSHLSQNLQGVPQVASSWTMCILLLHFSHNSIALNLIFTAYTLSPTLPNCLSSLQQMEPTPSKVLKSLITEELRTTPWQSTPIQESSQSSFPMKCLRFSYLPSCIIVRITNIANFINEAGRWYRSGHWWWWNWGPKWGHRRFHLIIWHRRRQCGSPEGGSTSRPVTSEQVIAN